MCVNHALCRGMLSILDLYSKVSRLHVGGARHQEVVVIVELECSGFGGVYLAGVGSV